MMGSRLNPLSNNTQNDAVPTVAVVITTYNNPRTLELCLLSFTNQTYRNFEIFIADDGSGDETRDLIQRFKREHEEIQTYHFWHPDQGYRKSKINNKVFSQLDPGKYPITICIDHDVVVHHRFVEDHYRIHQKENFGPTMFMGRRVDLSEDLTTKINPENVLRLNQGLTWDLILSGWKGETKNIMRSVRLDPPDWILKLMKRDRVEDLLGSNFSINTRVLHEVNGYNEDFNSYWGEDGDLFVRVRNSGVKCVGKIGYAVQWHLYHKRLEETPEHIAVYRALLNDYEYKRCKNGITKA
jgi:glycosyltransferase involved in cell wall biosynthesis